MLERITNFMSHPDLIFGCVLTRRTSPFVRILIRKLRSAESEPEAEVRFLRVLRYYMSGWHNKPRGVKKPCVCVALLQVLAVTLDDRIQVQPSARGNIPMPFRVPGRLQWLLCRGARCATLQCIAYKPDNLASVSHHPPISAYFYLTPANKVLIAGELRPKSRFLGNSVSTIMEGVNRVQLMGKEEDGSKYHFGHRGVVSIFSAWLHALFAQTT